jgi:hypothetical protein
MKTTWLVLALGVSALLATAQPTPSGQAAQALPSEAVLQIDYSNPRQSPAKWTLTIHANGRAHFVSEAGKAEPVDAGGGRAAAAYAAQAPLPGIDREVDLSPRFANRVFETARRHSLFNEPCESGQKVAFVGWKKLSYRGPEGDGSCTFNYAKDKEVDQLGDDLVAAASTILTGTRLELLLQHDRLGLDAEMESFTQAVNDQQAGQMSAIRGILNELTNDPRVMERVKRRARALLILADKE